MSREWKPGDVAVIVTPNDQEHVAMRTKDGWHCSEMPGNWSCVGEPRSLVVIDPEDREAVERLAAVMDREFERRGWANQSTPDPDVVDAIQQSLRELADPKPPKPYEPTSIFAMVEDDAGRLWYRSAEQASVWRLIRTNLDGKRYAIPDALEHSSRYDEIAAVRVLSEGIDA